MSDEIIAPVPPDVEKRPLGSIKSQHEQPSPAPEPIEQTGPQTAIIHGVGWNKPTVILALFLVGLTASVGHHMFYLSLDGESAKKQRWTIRIGTAIAYITGHSLAVLCGLCRDQWLWHTLSKRSFSLKSINAIFGVSSNLGHFLHFDMVKLAKIATLLAAVKWVYAPLMTLSTPSTISVITVPHLSSTNYTINSLKFNYDTGQHSMRLDRTDVSYLSWLYYNSSSGYLGKSPQAMKNFGTSALSGRVSAKDSSAPYGSTVREHCASNCTYSIEFLGPSVNCTEIDPATIGQWTKTHLHHLADCESPGNDNTTTYLPIFHSQRWNNSVTSFWALYTTPAAPDMRVACRKKYAYSCQASVSRYTVNETMSGHHFLEPQVVAVEMLYNIEDAHLDFAYAPNWSLTDFLISLLEGERGWYITNSVTESHYKRQPTENATTLVSATPLVDFDITLHPLGPAIENMVHKMAVSLVSDTATHFSANTSSICTSIERVGIYRYRPLDLILPYSIALGIAAIIAALGIHALVLNREKNDTSSSFISIFHVLKNSKLDHSVPAKEKMLKCRVISPEGEVGFYEVPKKPKS
ncbi:hypothetical protein DFP73DRAFT_618000 [Morchella snyderi]|nr:hypothetical protein DFP73DRAFT_618000 [Morchella snyderi]